MVKQTCNKHHQLKTRRPPMIVIQKQMRPTHNHRHATAVLVISFSLSLFTGCNLERFRHEKYSCNSSRLEVYDIIVRHAKKGGTAKITGSGGEREATITSIDSNFMMIEGSGISLQINRETGRVTAQKRNKYYSMQCELSVFTL